MAIRPGGEYPGRPLNIIWLLDCSGSMSEGGKIEALNHAIRAVIPAMHKAAESNPEVQFYVRAIRFSSGAAWHVATPTLLADFKWVDLTVEGETDMGQAFALLAEDFRTMPQDARALPPQIVLISDGKPTDDWKGALQALFSVPWGQRAVRQAIAIGQVRIMRRCRNLSTTWSGPYCVRIARSNWCGTSATCRRRWRRLRWVRNRHRLRSPP